MAADDYIRDQFMMAPERKLRITQFLSLSSKICSERLLLPEMDAEDLANYAIVRGWVKREGD